MRAPKTPENTPAPTRGDGQDQKAVVPAYQPTQHERSAISSELTRLATEPAPPRLKVSFDGERQTLGPDHPSELVGRLMLSNALGGAGVDFTNWLVDGIAQATSRSGMVEGAGLNSAVAAVHALKPRDGVEAMLMTQMATIHRATMDAACRLAQSENVIQLEVNDRCFNRLARTYAAQIEALKRYRSAGEQRMVVEHVTVQSGGQAIVGVMGGGGARNRKGESTS